MGTACRAVLREENWPQGRKGRKEEDEGSEWVVWWL